MPLAFGLSLWVPGPRPMDCRTSTFPARDVEQVTPYHRAFLFLIKTTVTIATRVLYMIAILDIYIFWILQFSRGRVAGLVGPFYGQATCGLQRRRAATTCCNLGVRGSWLCDERKGRWLW
jgi:hypothetical protein